MIRALIFILKLAVLVAGAVWLVSHPGRVVLNWQGYEVTTSVAVLLVAVAVLVVIAVVLHSLWRALIGVPQSLSLAHLSRRQRKGYVALTQGLVAVAAGDGNTARKLALKAEKYLKEPTLTLLLQAQAAQVSGDESAASRHYGAMLTRPDVSLLGLRGLISQALARGDYNEALTLARRARLLQPKAEWVLTELVQLEARTQNWEAALEVLGKAVRAGSSLSPARVRDLRSTFLLGQSLRASAQGLKDDANTFARRAHEQAVGFVPAGLVYARSLIASGRGKLAGKIIERVWRLHPHPHLVPLYLEALPMPSATDELRRLQRLASFNPTHMESQLALAQGAVKAHLWGVAHEALAKILPATEDARVYQVKADLARLEKNNANEAALLLQQMASSPAPSLWLCSDCGHAHESWVPLCSRCATPASLVWTRGSSASNGLIHLNKSPLLLTSHS